MFSNNFSRLSFILTVTLVLFGHVVLTVQASFLSNALFYLHTALSNKNSFNSFFSPLEDIFKSANLPESLCLEQIKDVATGILTRQEWALSMIDAFGKPEPDILGENLVWTGSYKECLNVQNRNGSISGKYCWLKFIPLNKKKPHNLMASTYSFGICVPDSCDEDHFQLVFPFMKNWLKKEDRNASIDCIHSPLDDLHKDFTALMAIAICCVIFIFVAVGTILDLRSKPDKEKNCSENAAQWTEFGKQMDIKKWVRLNNFLIYFSIHSNFKKLFYLETLPGTFSELNGLKVIATVLVVYTHTFTALFLIVNNPSETGLEFGSWHTQLTFQIYTVDIFFLVTGFLTFNGILAKYFKIRENINVFKFIISYIFPRYLKMLIVPGIIVFVSRIGLQPYLSSGPFWKVTDEICRDSWWRNVLFVSNFWTMSDQCFSAWWFLSASMQLHVIALIIIIPLIKKRYFACVFNGCVMLAFSCCWLTFQSYATEVPPLYPTEYSEVSSFRKGRRTFFNTFDKPHFHFGAYFIGMILSWILFKHKNAIAITKKQLYLGWSLSSVLFYVTMYGIYLEPNNIMKSLHTAFGVTMYSLSIAWVIIICNLKNGGLISSVLRWKYWLPLSKLSLTVYLIHPTVVDTFYLSKVAKIDYSFSLFIATAMRNLVVSFAIAIFATLMVEMPINALIDLNMKHLFATKSHRINT